MFDNLEIFQISDAKLRHAGNRQALLARNMANADTPGYRSQDLPPFKEFMDSSQGDFQLRASRSSHLNGAMPNSGMQPVVDENAPADPNGNSVSLEIEMMRAAEVKGHHDRALAIYKSSLSLLRTSLGRN